MNFLRGRMGTILGFDPPKRQRMRLLPQDSNLSFLNLSEKDFRRNDGLS